MGSEIVMADGILKKLLTFFKRKQESGVEKHRTITEEEIMAGYEKVMSYRYMPYPMDKCTIKRINYL